MTDASSRIALVGDLHSSWDDADSAYFSKSDYHTILVTGDLGSSVGRDGVEVAMQKIGGQVPHRAVQCPGSGGCGIAGSYGLV